MSSKLQKYFYEKYAGLDWPSYNDYIDDVDIESTQIKKEISDLENNKEHIFKEGYDYLSRLPLYGKDKEFTQDQLYKLTESKTFCMLPWTHMHAFPDGRAYPCCLADYWHPVGDLRKNTMAEVWNQDPYKAMRKNMVEGKSCKECTKCYEQETEVPSLLQIAFNNSPTIRPRRSTYGNPLFVNAHGAGGR
jgi:radical SAM protein with 4Fe4S-binding SPASM domain